MSIEKKKCTSKEHRDIDAIVYCSICNIYMCSKCDNFHANIFQNHIPQKLDKDQDFFTGFCQEDSHYNEKLEFYCKDHKVLCCGLCLCKIKKGKKGQHTDCDVCHIEEIKDEKKKALKDNIKSLENLSNDIQGSLNELKKCMKK